MSITDRDRKILLLLAPIVIVGIYWFLLLSPQREQAASLGDQLAEVQGEHAAAESQLALAEAAKANAPRDYAAVVALGKAIPTTVDTPSLIVQLDSAARGTGIAFERVATGERQVAPPPPADTDEDDAPAAEAGGERAGTGPGKAVEAANEVAGQPSGGAAATIPTGGLDTVPLEFTFRGSFFELADFFHQMKRFVRAGSKAVDVRGRLLTIDGFTLTAGDAFPKVTAEVTATVYLSPRQGSAGGLGVAAAGATTEPAPAGEQSPAPTPPSTQPPISTAIPR